MAPKETNWSREQLLVAFTLYCQLPFGKMHKTNPDIIRLAGLIGRTPSALAMKLTNIASLDPAITSNGRKGLTGASKSDREMWAEMHADWERFLDESQSAMHVFARQDDMQIAEPLITAPDSVFEELADYSAENRTSQTQIRIGQDFFRRSVMSAYRGRCCITGITESKLLVASHIVPWREDKTNRLNPRNGLCLSALHDKAFDQGLFTLTPDFKIKNSGKIREIADNSFVADWLIKLEGRRIDLPEKFEPVVEFVDWHNDNIFLGI